MKIGIITVHRAYNYGSVLQCYALQQYLASLGHNVSVIDYRQTWTESVYKPFSLYYVWHFIKKRDIRAIIDYWRKRKARTRRLERTKPFFESFIKKIPLTTACKYKIPKGFDVYLIGSDQLWSHQCVGGEDRIYLGYFKRPKESKLIGYSLSASIPSLYKYGSRQPTEVIGNFDKLSVREHNNSELIYELTGIKLPVTIDPTILVDSKVWDSMINKTWQDRNYIAIYQVRPVEGDSTFLEKKAVILSNRLQCEVLDLSSMHYSVEDFVSIIKYAKCVLTTSYHATVFSLLMETPCYAVKLGDGFDVRYVDLLTDLDLETELVDENFDPVPLSVDFSGLKEKICAYRKFSVEYLCL